MEENEISFYIRKAIFKTYNTFGPGLLESFYEKVLKIELEKNGLAVQSQIPLNVVYEGQILDIGFRADLLVEDKVIIEIKSVEEISAVHHKQLLTYLKLTNKKLGILVNFNTDYIDKSIFRKVNNL